MSFNLGYSFYEGILGLRRARFTTTITISTIALTLTLLGVFLLITVNVNKIIGVFREKMTLEVFIDNSLDTDSIMELKLSLSKIIEIEDVIFISREEALEKFRTEFGKDPITILGENPLPQSFQIKLKTTYRKPDIIEEIVKKIEKFDEIDEVVYHGQLFRLIDQYSSIVLFADAALFVFVLLSAVLLVANTLRLTILSQKKTIQIMELVGAKKGFIRRPYLIQGLIQGGIGGLMASLLLWIFVKLVSLRFTNLFEISPIFIFIIIFLGIIFGYIGSQVGLKKFLKYNNA
jgi:cell division transport system permease protein